jgi:hypothetical protein
MLIDFEDSNKTTEIIAFIESTCGEMDCASATFNIAIRPNLALWAVTPVTAKAPIFNEHLPVESRRPPVNVVFGKGDRHAQCRIDASDP